MLRCWYIYVVAGDGIGTAVFVVFVFVGMLNVADIVFVPDVAIDTIATGDGAVDRVGFVGGVVGAFIDTRGIVVVFFASLIRVGGGGCCEHRRCC